MDGLTQDDSEFVSCLAVIGSHMQVTPEGFAPAMKQNDQNEYNDPRVLILKVGPVATALY